MLTSADENYSFQATLIIILFIVAKIAFGSLPLTSSIVTVKKEKNIFFGDNVLKMF